MNSTMFRPRRDPHERLKVGPSTRPSRGSDLTWTLTAGESQTLDPQNEGIRVTLRGLPTGEGEVYGG
ncbi:hypothetical protein SI65_09415 [Aspergillus cristatus]|uniref:Uncharacterized protein n=1 Tax=Aspergillus cristatus TaxID=573508 RepID=A0A1E3B421_ASPCR|nr:hypothetical protein SI65_09415 [Aspergillus cristatus]